MSFSANRSGRPGVLQKFGIFIAVIVGVIIGLYGPNWSLKVAESVSTVFMRLLKFVSLPIISLSLMATISGLDKSAKVWQLSKKIISYTVLTTVISATLALFLFEMVKPVENIPIAAKSAHQAICAHSYCDEALKVIPDNLLKPFVDYHVISVFIISILIGLAILVLPDMHRKPMSQSLHRIFLVIMQITKWIVQVLPIAVIAFIAMFIKEVGHGLEMGALSKYLGVITASNLIHGFVLLPLLLFLHKIPVVKTLKGMFPVLSLAFFSKSSAASMPSAIETAETKLGVTPAVSRFSFPMCTTINMNACAAFILTTVLFVAQSNGIPFTMMNKILWIFIATVAALGNAGVPMGCFFLTNALLTAFNVPVELMGVILPFYGLLDMLESSVNIWSDSCVTVIVDRWWKKNHEK
jgi:Na+/H+-dicarboxylate symporter